MGSCMSTQLPPNVFKVTPINNGRHNIQDGIMVVTRTNLRYTDSHTDEELQWPLMYIRNWACDGDKFSFEAGKKCLGGEGIYVFTTNRASHLFQLVAHNLKLLPKDGQMSLPSRRHPSETLQSLPPPLPRAGPSMTRRMSKDTATLTPPPPLPPLPEPSVVTTPHKVLPPLPEPSVVATTTPYTVLEFDVEPKPFHPLAAHDASKYTTIDFAKPPLDAKKHSQSSVSFDSNNKVLPRNSSGSSVVGSPRNSSITSPNFTTSLNAQGAPFNKVVDRPQSNCEGGGAPDQPSPVLTSTPQDGHSSYANITTTPKPNDPPYTRKASASGSYSNKPVGQEVPSPVLTSTPQDGHSSYANINITTTPKPNDPPYTPLSHKASVSGSYSNKPVGQEVPSPVLTSTPQDGHSSYANINITTTPKPNDPPYTPLSHKASASGSYSNKPVGQEVPSPVLTSTSQDSQSSYANITLGPTVPKSNERLPTQKMSVSVTGSGNYPELDLSASVTSATSLHAPNPTQLTPIPELGTTDVEHRNEATAGAGGVAAVAERPKDADRVNYGLLDFNAMKGLEVTQKQRELLKQGGGEPMNREKDRSVSTQSHKKQK